MIALKKEFNSPDRICLYKINDMVSNKFNFNNKNNSILIIEPFLFHNECTPGFSKYFTDLGYNVDIIMSKIGISSLCLFEPINKIRLFIYGKNEEIIKNIDYFNLILKKYSYILIETAEPKMSHLYTKLNLLNNNNSIFVFHHIDYSYSLPFANKLKNTQIWTLGNFSNGTQVIPHYFGDIKKKRKNKKTKFFITSTINRKYNLLVSSAKKIKKENLKFHIMVVGRTGNFSKTNIPEDLKDNFSFKYRISYKELYKIVYNSDYIIINLDPNNAADVNFQKIRVSGSSQLVYGFLKPVLINEEFARFYNFNSSNSLIYDNSNFSKVMKDAINLHNKEYKKLQENLSLLSNEIYSRSLSKVKNCLKELMK